MLSITCSYREYHLSKSILDCWDVFASVILSSLCSQLNVFLTHPCSFTLNLYYVNRLTMNVNVPSYLNDVKGF